MRKKQPDMAVLKDSFHGTAVHWQKDCVWKVQTWAAEAAQSLVKKGATLATFKDINDMRKEVATFW